MHATVFANYTTHPASARHDSVWLDRSSPSPRTQSSRFAFDNDTQWQTFVYSGNWNQTVNGGGPDADMNLWAYQVATTTTPEPASLVLFASGLMGIAMMRRRHRRD